MYKRQTAVSSLVAEHVRVYRSGNAVDIAVSIIDLF